MAEESTNTPAANQPDSDPASANKPVPEPNGNPNPADGGNAPDTGADDPLLPNAADEEGGQNQDPKPADDQSKPDDKSKPNGAPEKYEDFKLPEGFTWDDARKGEAATLFKELDLPQDKAQKLVDAYCKAAKDQQTADEAQLMNRRKQWRSEVQSRPDFREQQALAKKGMQTVIRTPDQQKLFQGSWLQDNPAIFDMFVAVGRLVAEDNMGGGNAPPPKKTETQINQERFPNL